MQLKPGWKWNERKEAHWKQRRHIYEDFTSFESAKGLVFLSDDDRECELPRSDLESLAAFVKASSRRRVDPTLLL